MFRDRTNQFVSLRFAFAVLAILFSLGMAGDIALAQSPADAAGRGERIAEDIKARLEKLGTDVSLASISNEELADKRNELEKLRAEALAAQKLAQKPLDEASAQLRKLGDAPEPGVEETEAITAERKRLGALVGQLTAVVKRLDLLNLEAAQLAANVSLRQRSDFMAMVFEGSRSVINPLLWYEGLAALPEFVKRLSALVVSWKTQGEEGAGGFSFVMFTFAAAYLLIAALWIGWRRPDKGLVPDDELSRIWRSLRIALYSIVVLLVAWAAIELMGNLQPRPHRLTLAVLRASVFAITSIAILRGIFRPRNTGLRLVDIASPSAVRAFQLGSVACVLVASRLIVEEVVNTTFLPNEFTLAWQAALSIALVVLIALFLVIVRRAAAMEVADGESAGRQFYFAWTRYVFHLIWLVLFVSVLALVMSRIALAHYLLTRTVSTAVLVVTLVLFRHLIDAVVRSALDENSLVGKFLRRTVSLGEKAISTLGLVLSSLADIGVVLLGVPMVMVQWTLVWIDFQSWLTSAFFGFRVGDITIEPSSILLGIFVLAAGLLISRLVTTWLERRILARTNLDAGVRNSIRTGTSYAGIMLAAGLAVTSAGLDFSNLAIVFGALGVGIGFGLQSIVNNFVSGLILLAERPIKVGDWITASGGEGIVKRINVRSTEIETFDRCSVIVPNSNLISEPVSNWYHNDVTGRVRIAIGVAYDSDPEQVQEILLNCAYGTNRVVAFPEPFVVFQNFGASSLDFELRAYIDDVGWITVVSSELRFKIFKALKEAGIEIPFPQQDIHVKGLTEDGVLKLAGMNKAGKRS